MSAVQAEDVLNEEIKKLKVFISYARTNIAFAEQLVAALEARDIVVLIDKRDLPLLEEWQRELSGFIHKADAIVYLVSEASIKSKWCEWEISQVIALNKRLAPVVVEALPANIVIPESIAKINFLFFTPPNAFDGQADKLAKALSTDLAWIKDHTRIGENAERWNEHHRPTAMLLRGQDIKDAEQWMLSRPREAPLPTELQTRFIIESRRAATRRRFILLGTAAITLVVLAVVSTFALLQSNEANRQQTIAIARRLTSAAELLRNQTPAKPDDIGPVERSIQLAAEAMRRFDTIGFRSLEADIAMRRGLALHPRRQAWLDGPNESGATASFDKIAFASDGSLAAVMMQPVLKVAIGDPHTRKLVVREAGAVARDVELSPDGRFLATVNSNDVDGAVDIWDVKTLTRVTTIPRLGNIDGIALAPDAAFLAVVGQEDRAKPDSGRATRLFDLRDRQKREPFARLPEMLAPSFSPDGAYLAGIIDSQASVWTVQHLLAGDAAPLSPIGSRASPVLGIFFTSDGKYLALRTGDNFETVQLWSTESWKSVRQTRRDMVRAVSPDGQYTAHWLGDGFIVEIVDTISDDEVARINATWERPAVAFGSDGQNIAIGVGPVLWQIAGQGGHSARIQVGPQAYATAFGADEASLTIFSHADTAPTGERVANLWDLINPTLGPRIDTGQAAGALAASADGRFLAVGSAGEVRILAANTAKILQSFTFEGRAQSVTLSPNGEFVAVETDAGALRRWQVMPPKDLGSIKLERTDGNALVIASDGTVVAMSRRPPTRVGELLELHIWNSATTKDDVRPIGRDTSGLAAGVCGLSADAKLAAIDLRTAIRIVDVRSGNEVGTIGELGSGALCAFNSDSRQLAVTGTEDTVRVWDVTTQTEVARIEKLPDVQSMSFSPSGKYISIMQKDGTIRVWLLRYEDLIAEACSRIARNFTFDEWQSYFGREPYYPTCPNLPIPDRAGN